MKLRPTITAVLVSMLMTGCQKKPVGMNRTINCSSDQAERETLSMLGKELTPGEMQRFNDAVCKLAAQWAASRALHGGDNDPTEFLQMLHGKTPQQIIDLASQVDVVRDQSPASPPIQGSLASQDEPKEQQFNSPFIIDGIEIRVAGVRIGKLAEDTGKVSLGSIPKGEFLLAAVTLKNVTEGTIIQIINAWKDTRVIDEFGNVYETPDSVSFSFASIKEYNTSNDLKPGENVNGLIIIEKPLDNARRFILTSDPGFSRRSVSGTLKQLSSEAFRIGFTREEIR